LKSSLKGRRFQTV